MWMAYRIKTFIKNEIVLILAFVLAVISAFFVPPDAGYFAYIDYRTLAILFSLMGIMCGLQRLGVFSQIGEMLVKKVTSMRMLAVVLMLLCFVFSMFITNDVALLTFVPFTIITLNIAGRSENLISVIVLETIAANLGSMMMPMGNPQNLYLYSLTDMTLGGFIKLMLPYGAVSLLMLLLLCCVLAPGTAISVAETVSHTRTRRENRLIILYVAAFVLALFVVMRLVGYLIGFGTVLVIMLVFDRKSLGRVDYSLLLTFVFLFIFIGNMKRIPAVTEILSGIVGGHEVISAVAASQVISNVPAAILLSGFTENIKSLVIGTNIGGLGTLIASMASLISFKQYGCTENPDKKKYIAVFTVLNIVFLAALLILNIVIG